jgi:glycine dehydrogenase subunit 2
MSVIFDISEKGKNQYIPAKALCSDTDPIPDKFLNDGIDLPDVNEVEIVRHYTKLSQMNYGVDSGMYPLGSCTMKYNPKINEKLASNENFSSIHPLSGESFSQGSLQVMHELSNMLSAITGMRGISLWPAAGAHGELTAVMVMKKYFESKGENRKTVLIPDSAHGTNPASVALCGYNVVSVPSTAEGDVDISKLKELITPDTAGMMLTSPNTLGLFDRNILQISDILKKNGSLFYGDGANFNAVIGTAKMSDMGFDLIHLNLHKTFSTPHGGGGPGSGPIGVTEDLIKYLPVPRIKSENGKYSLNSDFPDTIGRVHSFYGNFLVYLKAYVYILALGASGIRDISRISVLNANYLLAKLGKEFNVPIKRSCMHEFIINDKGLPNHVTTNDIAKRLLDYGFHAPTVYFPLIIDGAMMIEPTETESRNSLDSFAETMIKIKKEIYENPDLVKNAPQNTPVRKVDAVTAARKPVLKWQKTN